MSKITTAKDYADFTKEAKFFYCKNPDVYGSDWSGTEEYIISSDTTEQELLKKYPEVMCALSPYLYCNAECGNAIAEGMRNTQKHEKRQQLWLHYSLDDESADNLISASQADPALTCELRESLKLALACCTHVERTRFVDCYLYGYKLREASGSSTKNAVCKSIHNAKKKMKKFLEAG